MDLAVLQGAVGLWHMVHADPLIFTAKMYLSLKIYLNNVKNNYSSKHLLVFRRCTLILSCFKSSSDPAKVWKLHLMVWVINNTGLLGQTRLTAQVEVKF